MIDVDLPDGRTISVDAPDEESAARAAHAFFTKNPAAAPAATEHPFPGGTGVGYEDQAVRGMPIVGGLMDKAVAAAGAGIQPLMGVGGDKSFGERYEQNLHDQGADAQQFQDAHPVGSTVARVAGGAAALAPLAAAAPAALGLGEGGLVANMGRAAATNAGIGGADAAIKGDNVATGALEGAAGGAASVPVGRVAGAAVRGVANKFLPDAAGKATSRIERAINDDQLASPGALPAKAAELGPDATLADMGPNLQRQAGAIAAQPGSGQKTVIGAMTDRQQNAGQRMSSALNQSMGNAVDPTAMAEKIVAQRSAAAKPLYDTAYAAPLKMTPELQEVLNRPAVKSAMETAKGLSANENVPQGMFEPPAAATPPAQMTAPQYQQMIQGGAKAPPPIDVRGLDLTKRVLDDMVSSSARSGNNNAARIVGNVRDRLVAEIDKQAPSYAAARDAYAGESKIKEALEAGRNIFKSARPDELASTLAGMSSGEKDTFQQGARAAIADTMGQNGNDALAVRSLFKRGWTRQKLNMVLGEADAAPLLKAVDNENTFANTSNRVMAGSDTAARTAANKEFPSAVEDTAVPHNLNWEGMVAYPFRKAASLVGGAAKQARAGQTGQDAANVLTATGQQRDDAIRALSDLIAGRRRNTQIGQGVKTGVSSALAASADR